MIEVKLIQAEDRFIMIDKDNHEYSNCARKADAKKILKKNEDLILVENFTISEDEKSYSSYKDFIINRFMIILCIL